MGLWRQRFLLRRVAPAVMAFVVLSAVPTAEAAKDVDQLPVYQPPKQMTPRARVGGELRGTDGDDPAIAALVPDHVGITVKQHPEFNWFLSKGTSLPIRFTLIDERSVQALVEKPLISPDRAGVQSVKLRDIDFALQPNIQYRWFVSLIKDADSPSRDIVSGGIVERCEFSECLVLDATTTCSRDTVVFSAANGFWYDAMACLSDLIAVSPDDAGLRKQRAALLKQVGLHEVAEWDLAQSNNHGH
jgi:hypothetical protein